jgi:hypothetical protein
MSALPEKQTGIVQKEGETVILLPAGPIRSKVEGASGQTYDQVLVDDPDLGSPVQKIQSTEVYTFSE